MTETTCDSLLETPAGWLRLKATQRALTHIAFVNDEEFARGDVGAENDADLTLAHAVLADARHQLGEYFRGTRTTFDVPVELDGTPFQREVWSTLEEIPFGQTRTYGEIAQMLGRPGASRAVGAANGQNPVGIIVPCHRVVGADGSLTGYAGGLGPKRWLLDHEQHHSPGAQMSLLDLG